MWSLPQLLNFVLRAQGQPKTIQKWTGGAVSQKMLFINSQWADFPIGCSLQTPGLGERVMMRRYGGSKQRKLTQEGGIIIIPIHGLEPGHKVSDGARAWYTIQQTQSLVHRATNTIPGGTRLMLLFHHNLNTRHVSTRGKREATKMT